MSRSKRKPYVKDKGMSTHEYWSRIRHEWKQQLNQNYYKDDFDLRKPKQIINDYDYCDYWWLVFVERQRPGRNYSWMYRWTEEDVKIYSRK